MGVGKTTVCHRLKKLLPAAVLLDGDRCWDMDPFVVNDETKGMVMQNISFMLNRFIKCSVFENIIFCWVMHEQAIIDTIIQSLDAQNCNIKTISLICDEDTLKSRLQKDIDNNIRSEDIIQRSRARIPMYNNLNTIKIDTNAKSILRICEEIKNL